MGGRGVHFNSAKLLLWQNDFLTEKIRFVVCFGLPYISQYVLEKHFNFEQKNWAYSFYHKDLSIVL